MAIGLQGLILYAKEAGEDLSNALFTFATLKNDGTILQSHDGTHIIGVIIETAKEGYPVSVQCDGIAKVKLGATLQAGTRVTADDGRAVDASSGAAAGVLLEGGNADEIVPVLLNVAAAG